MWIKIAILLIFAGILLSLGSGLFYLVHDRGDSRRTLRALTLRIGLSVGLFLLLMILAATGVITPHGVVPSHAVQQPAGGG